MEFAEVVRRRRMVRSTTREPVDPAVVDRVLRTALSGPSAGFSQGQSLVVVDDPDLRNAIAALAEEPAYLERGFPAWISAAPVLVVVCTSRAAYEERYAEPDKAHAAGPDSWRVPYHWVDAGCVLMLLLLAAADERLAAGFLGAHRVPGLADALRLPADVEPLGVVTLGHPAPDRPSASLRRGRRPAAELIHRNGW